MHHSFIVTGMTCGHCEMAVQRAIKAIDPLAAIAIDRAKNQVDVDSQHPKETLVKAIADEGYTVVA